MTPVPAPSERPSEGPRPSTAAAVASSPFVDLALDLAGVPVWRLDLRNGRFHMNAAGWQVVGLPDRPEGAPVDEVRAAIHPEDFPAVVRAAEEARAGDGVVDVVARYRRADGPGWRTMLTRRVTERDAAGRAVSQLGVGLDMTALFAERARADALAERSRLVAQAMGVGFWTADVRAGTLEWDEQMFRLHRRDPALGPPRLEDWLQTLIHEEDRAWLGLRMRSYRDDPDDSIHEVVLRLVDGADGPRWVRAWTCRTRRPDGSRLQLGMTLDVTEQQRERALREHERDRLAVAVQAAEVGIWERDTDGRVVYWNDVMYRMRGLDPKDPRPVDELARLVSDPDDLARLSALARRSLEDGRPYGGELRVAHADGSQRWLHTEGRPVRDAQGRFIGIVGVHLDITGRKQAERRVADTQRLEQASRDKSAFLARMSHELRTPLNAILGFARLLEDDPRDRPSTRQAERLLHIRHSAAQLLGMIDEVLELARTESEGIAVAREDVALESLLQAPMATLAPMVLERGLRLRWPEPALLRARVRVDPPLAERALVALLRQTLRGAPRGGEVVVSVPEADRGHEAEGVVLTVEAPDLRRGEASADLDTELARRWIAAMGGEVRDLEPLSGRGGWRLRLVHVPAAAVPAPSGPAPGSAVAAAPVTVLYVEDNPVNLLLVRELLALRPAVRLIEAEDGAQGRARALAERPALVLLDMQLPDTDGTTLMRQLRREPALAGAVFVALSADAMPEHIAVARAAGFDDYWTKPLDFERFLAGIDRFVGQRPV